MRQVVEDGDVVIVNNVKALSFPEKSHTYVGHASIVWMFASLHACDVSSLTKDCNRRAKDKLPLLVQRVPNGEGYFYYKKLPPLTLAGFYLTTHSSSLLGGRWR
jgi:hypothetical protein